MRQLTSLLFLALIASIGEQATAKSATLAGSSIACQAQKAQTVHATSETNLYLAGAVPEVNGQVVFQQVYAVPGKTRDFQRAQTILGSSPQAPECPPRFAHHSCRNRRGNFGRDAARNPLVQTFGLGFRLCHDHLPIDFRST